MSRLSIGRVAEQAGVGVETVRFYEREGLIADPPRRPSGYREYPPDVVPRITFIRRARDLGFSLKQIRQLLELRVHPRRSCDAARRGAEATIAEIEDKIASLKRMRDSLTTLVGACETREPTGECPILECLNHE